MSPRCEHVSDFPTSAYIRQLQAEKATAERRAEEAEAALRDIEAVAALPGPNSGLPERMAIIADRAREALTASRPSTTEGG